MGRIRFFYLRCLGLLSSSKLAFPLLVALTIGAIIGTLFPQRPSVRDETLLSLWQDAVSARYGGYTRIFDAFHSAWFLGLVAALIVNIIVCTTTRLRSIWRALTRTSMEITDALLTHCEARFSFTARDPDSAVKIIARNLKQAGFRVLYQEQGKGTHIYAERHGWARLGTILVHGPIILIVLAATWGQVKGWRIEALALPPGVETPVERAGFQLRGESFEIIPYPDGSARDFRAQVAVLEAGRVVQSSTIRINEPLSYHGVGIYLVSFDEDETGCLYPIAMAVYDPSYPFVISGALCFVIGAMLRFYLPVRRVWCRVGRDGVVEIGADAKYWLKKWADELRPAIGG
ncbi:MAG: cytochrome c biogenesis protein ResB [Chloroflexi bacterium]|nr:cytochrome c biogenesis protein ResB [Chloroflexota bacterium]